MPRIRKRTSSSKKKKKKSTTSSSSGTSNQLQNKAPLDLNQILSQADVAYETSDAQTALQLYAYAQSILRQQIQNLQQQQTQNNTQEQISKIMTCAKVACKIGEIKVSFHDPHDNGYNDFMNGIQLLSQENEQKYIHINDHNQRQQQQQQHDDLIMMAAQWKEARANLFLYLGQLSCEKNALSNFTNSINDLKECISILEQIQNSSSSSSITSTGIMNNSPSPTSMMVATGGEQQHLVGINNITHDDEESMDVKMTLFETRKQLCGAYCSIAELYLTDLCYEPNAEQECEQSLILALELDKILGFELKQQNGGRNDDDIAYYYAPDAIQAMANLRLCQNRPMEAIPYILDAYGRMRVGCEALADLVGLGKDQNEKQHDKNDNDMEEKAAELKGDALKAANSLPGFEFRCQTAKILLECAANLVEQSKTNETGASIEDIEEKRLYCIESAIHTLGSLLAENDEVIETFYLLGCAFQSKSVNDHEAAKYYFENALQMLVKTKEQIHQSGDGMMDDAPFGDDGMMDPLQDINQKIDDVKKKIIEVDSSGDSQMDED